MADGFRVVLDDLRAMRAKFLREHDEYVQIGSRVTPVVAATGDSRLDETLRAVIDALALMHAALAARIEEHAGKLAVAADSYERSDIDAHGLFDDLMEP